MFENLPQFLFQSFVDIASTLRLINILEILVLTYLVFKVYKYISGSHAEQLLKGILMLLLALLLSKAFNLQIIGKVLESVVNIVIFSLVVIFQPELRRLLGYLGQRGFLSKNMFVADTNSEAVSIIEEIINAVKYFSKTHTGALIVFHNTSGIENTIEVGTKLNAQLSSELLITIFQPNTPLHDGAVVVNGDKIIASGVLLPLTEDPKLSWQYGTRHRAAIGMSEVSDATCLVVSEETGNISMAQGGKLLNIEGLDDLKAELEFLYGVSESVKENSAESVKEKSRFRFEQFLPVDLPKYSMFKKEQNK